nr:MAG TPA: hypothetical protein [Caudoviricetes sp.]
MRFRLLRRSNKEKEEDFTSSSFFALYFLFNLFLILLERW